jgi:nucleoside phosphorylase/hypoxanthine phosphoribosyltransferase
MSVRRDYFLSQFDSSFRGHIIEFSKRLTKISEEYDVLIFLARKAACLADCLGELELSYYSCVITSSRVLDMDLSWLKSKTVAIIDDALISGTTINDALRKLKGFGIVNVDTYVLSVDENWWAKELINPMPSYFRLNSEQTSLICANIVSAISVVPRPYTIDYPLFKNIRIKGKDFQDLSNSADWIVYESTSSHQEKHNILNLTIVPSESTLLLFLDEIGLSIVGNSLFKLRLYALQIKDVFWCQLLPIVILPPITEGELLKLFDRISGYFENENTKSWFESNTKDDSLKCKLRLVQYYIGSRLSRKWHNSIINIIDSNITLEQDFRNLNFLFPPPISYEIRDISSKETISFNDLNVQFSCEVESDVVQSEEEDFDESVALHKLSKPFLDLYRDKEVKARKLVKEFGIEVFENEEYKTTINRLNQGYSISDLKGFLSGISSRINPDKLISYFLDLYIDKGAVVPITYVKDGQIYRAFRHGEDVEFAENEIRLCVSMLEKFSKEYGELSLPRTIVEKLLVLFVRVGIEKDFLSISTNPISDLNTIGIRYYLHGAVVGSFDKSIYKVNFDNSLTHVLEEAGYLHRAKSDEFYTLTESSKSGVDIRGLNQANQLGLVMGNLLNRRKPKINLDELILLSTCPYVIDLVGALAAEVYIFQGFYLYQRREIFREFANNNSGEFARIRKQKAFTALNSGTWKFENFRIGSPWKAIQKASNSFSNELYSEVWKSFWPSTGKETSAGSTNPQLNGLVDKLAELLFSVRFYISLIELSLSSSLAQFRESEANVESQEILSKTKKYLPKLFEIINPVYDSAIEKYRANELKKEGLYIFCTEKINKDFQLGRQILSEVDALANNFGKVDKVAYYDHAVVIDYKFFNIHRRDLNEIFSKVINQLKIEAKRNDQTYLFEIPNQYSAIKTGIWICSQGKNSRRWLLRLCAKLDEALSEHSTLKFTFFFHLEAFSIIKKVSSNQYYAPLFWDIAKELLKSKFKTVPGSELVYFTISEPNRPFIEEEIKNELTDFFEYNPAGRKAMTIEKPYNMTFRSNHYIKQRKEQIKNIMDIGIITIVAEELAAVTDFFKENNSYLEKRGTQSARTYYFGRIDDKNEKGLNVVVIQAIEQGNRSVISAYNALSEEFNPTVIILLGIAGSINSDLKICDVAICDSTYYYDKRAETENGTKHRIDSYKMNAWTKEFIRRYHHENKSEEPSFSSSDNSPNSTFTSYFGPIGTGEAVIKFKEAEERKWLLSVNEKTLAVETEAGGAAQQFYEDELNYSRRAKGIIVIRGISDKADIEKKNQWRLAAAKNAVKVLVEIFKANYLE